MKFGEKVRTARLEAGLSQKKLAQMTGISLRTIQNYERGERMPKKREYYTYLADALHIELDSLIDDNADLVRRSAEHYGSRGQKQAMALTQQVSALFSSGRLENGEMDDESNPGRILGCKGNTAHTYKIVDTNTKHANRR